MAADKGIRANTMFQEGPISPNLSYTTSQLAQIFGVAQESLHKKYIYTQEWLHTCLFKGVYVVPGWVIIKWIDGNLTGWEEDEQQSDE